MSPTRRPGVARPGCPATTCGDLQATSRDPIFAASGGGSGTVAPAMPSQARRTRPVVISVGDDLAASSR